jgi:hypothetical protein
MPDDPVAELYGLPLHEFVAGRDTLARELRRDGEKQRAAEVVKLKKPSVAAWAVNQLARENRKQLDLLLDAGHRLRAGQEELLEGGDRKKFEAARRDHERAVRELVGSAGKLLEQERGATSEQVLSSVERTLRYASIDEEQRAMLASGRLTAEVDAPGFGAFTGTDRPSAAPRRRPVRQEKREQPKRESQKQGRQEQDRKEQQRRERRARVAAAEEALKLAREREREARQEVREAERGERKASQDFERATKELAAARAALDAASHAVEEASELVKAERRTVS